MHRPTRYAHGGVSESGHRTEFDEDTAHAARLSDGRLLAYVPSAALLDNGEADVRAYYEVVFRGFPVGARVSLAYHDPRTMQVGLQEVRDADASGNVSITRGVLSAMPSMEDWVVEATVGD